MPYSYSKISLLYFLLPGLFLCIASVGFTGNGADGLPWHTHPFDQRVFIENKGQLDKNIMFASKYKGVDIYFTLSGIIFEHADQGKCKKSSGEKKNKNPSARKVNYLTKLKKHSLEMQWENSNSFVQITAEDRVSNYFTYSDLADPAGKSTIIASAYKKIVYRNLYNGIDAEYFFPEKGGIKYSLIVHPGADFQKIKMAYKNAGMLKLNEEGDLIIESTFGQFTDHAPQSFYEDGTPVMSSFAIEGNTISFQSDAVLRNGKQILIIDPWTTVPTFAGADKAYDVDWDYFGNVYIYGGQHPYQLSKLNNAGVVQWTYTSSAFTAGEFNYYGDFCVDRNTGTAYLCEAFNSTQPTRLLKINTLGNQVVIFPGNSLVNEFWNIAFNSCTKQGVIGCGNTTNPYQGATFDTNLTSISPVNLLSTSETFIDIIFLTIDDTNAYMVTTKNGSSGFENSLIKAPLSTLAPTAYIVNTGYDMQEVGSVMYASPYEGTNSFNGMAKSNDYLFTWDGATLKKWNPANGALISSINIHSWPGGKCGGIAVDGCNNIFIGTADGVKQYDSTLVFITSVPTTDTVYDLDIGIGGQIIACGRSFVAALPLYSSCASSSSALNLNVTSSGSTCAGNDGTASVTVTGGTPPYNYIWQPVGQTTPTATGLAPGTYTVIVFENSGMSCSSSAGKVDSVAVFASAGFTSQSQSFTPVSCFGGNDGTATITVSGGTTPCTYVWSVAGQTDSTATGLSAGMYYVTVTDASGCQTKDSIMVFSSSAALSANPVVTEISCFGPGSIYLMVTGGIAPYTFLWSNGDTTQSQPLITIPGLYAVSITDANACVFVLEVMMSAPPISAWVTTSISVTAACNGNNGAVIVHFDKDSSQTINVQWYDGAMNNIPGDSVVSGLSPGTYTCYINDNNLCKDSTFNVTIGFGFLSASVTPVNPLCFGDSSGYTTISSISGTPPYTFQWSTNASNQITATATGLTAGTYSVTVMDSSGCQLTLTCTLTQPPPLNVLISSNNDTLCSGDAAILTAYGGVIYNWSNGAMGNSITVSPLLSGSYIVTATDLDNCIGTDTFSITVVSPLVTTISVCEEDSMTITSNGGNAYLWNTGANDSSITVPLIPPGIYSVTVTTDCGTVKDSIFVNGDSLILAIVSNDTSITSGTSIQLAAHGGNSYLWNTGAVTPQIVVKPTESTMYLVTITDANGCRDVDSIKITVEELRHAISVPTIFTPNGDGKNEVIRVHGFGVKEYTFIVYNRWGEVIFEDRGALLSAAESVESWDGSFNGIPLNSAVFAYTLDAVFNDETIFNEKGSITLIR